jgi:hypothetical protein
MASRSSSLRLRCSFWATRSTSARNSSGKDTITLVVILAHLSAHKQKATPHRPGATCLYECRSGLLQSTLTNPAEFVIASEAKQSPWHFEGLWGLLRRFAPRNDRCGVDFAIALHSFVCRLVHIGEMGYNGTEHGKNPRYPRADLGAEQVRQKDAAWEVNRWLQPS